MTAANCTSTVPNQKGKQMSQDQHPGIEGDFLVTFFLVVSDQDRSRNFYQSVFGGKVLLDRDPVILEVANATLILNDGGGPTDDKPTVTLTTPPDPDQVSAFLNIRVTDIATASKVWSARGAKFLTEPKDHGREIRAYIRDPDGHLIEVGQITPTPSSYSRELPARRRTPDMRPLASGKALQAGSLLPAHLVVESSYHVASNNSLYLAEAEYVQDNPDHRRQQRLWP